MALITDKPTWEYPIRGFFNDIDINHMLQVTFLKPRLDLGDYKSVEYYKDRILDSVSGTPPRMPIPPSEPWSPEMVATFKQWIDNGCPEK